jgi:predicted secreted protein
MMQTSAWRRLIVVGVATATLGTLAGCSSDAAGSSRPKVVTPTEGSTVSATVGSPFVVRLASNPTTGYSWSVKTNPPGITFLKSTYEEPKTDKAGAPGQQLLTFKPTRAGTSKLVLIYDRPFAPTEPSKSLSFSVDATKS